MPRRDLTPFQRAERALNFSRAMHSIAWTNPTLLEHQPSISHLWSDNERVNFVYGVLVVAIALLAIIIA